MLISGSGGLIGSAFAASLEARGHDVERLERNPRGGSPFFRDADFEGADAAVNLCGYGIMRRWNSSVKKEIENSRVESASYLASVFSRLNRPPKVFLCASATGFYGSRADEILNEQSAEGEGFLARVAGRWEAAAKEVPPSVRVVNLRFGIVLSSQGGALKTMKLPFKLGLGAVAGDGSGYMGWISLKDAVRAMEFAMENETVSGAVNIVSPSPSTNREFTRAVARAVGRKVFLSVPAGIIKLVFGEMGGEVITASARAVPGKLADAGFEFEDENLDEFLLSELSGGG